MSFDQANSGDHPDQPRNEQPGDNPSGADQAQTPYGQQADPYGQQGAFGQPSASQPSASQQVPGEQQPWGNQPAQGQPGGWGGGQGDWGQQGHQPQGQNPWDQNQASAGTPQAGFGPPQQDTASGQIKEANPLKAMFDFSFNTFATPGLVKLVYILSMVLGAVMWIAVIISAFAAGTPTTIARSPGAEPSAIGGFNPVPGILAILVGWIPVFLWVLLIRIGLEFALATVRTSEDVRHIRANANDND